MHKHKRNLHWLNRDIKKSQKRKARLHKQTKQTGNSAKFRQYQHKCKREMRKTEWEHINNTIEEGMNMKNSKPFWNYIKSNIQDNKMRKVKQTI